MKNFMLNPFESHPILGPIYGLAFTVFHLVMGCVIAVKKQVIIKVMIAPVSVMLHFHQPPIIAEILQDGAWGMAIISGMFVSYGIWKTHHGKKKGK